MGDADIGPNDSVPDDIIDRDLYERTKALLEPGEIELIGSIVHTDLTSDQDIEMHQATVDIGDLIAKHTLDDPKDWYVYSGTDDSRFASNLHQGLTISGDEFVWECQQLLRKGTFDIVIYYEASINQEQLVTDIESLGYRVTPVP